MLMVLVVAAIAVQVWAWRRVRRQIMTGGVGRAGGILRFDGWALLPAAAWVAGCFAHVGVEQLSGQALVPEPVGRAMLPMTALLLVLGIVAWVAFAVASLRARR